MPQACHWPTATCKNCPPGVLPISLPITSAPKQPIDPSAAMSQAVEMPQLTSVNVPVGAGAPLRLASQPLASPQHAMPPRLVTPQVNSVPALSMVNAPAGGVRSKLALIESCQHTAVSSPRNRQVCKVPAVMLWSPEGSAPPPDPSPPSLAPVAPPALEPPALGVPDVPAEVLPPPPEAIAPPAPKAIEESSVPQAGKQADTQSPIITFHIRRA
jgi:hypothetical protein